MTMRITIVFDAPELCGGVINAVSIARLLQRDGHRVTLSARGGPPAWLAWRGAWHDHQGFQVEPPAQDLVIATYWTTVAWAKAAGWPKVVHFCQGYEGDLIHLAAQREAIEAVYRHPFPTWVVSPMLVQRLAPFGRRAMVLPPHVSPRFRPAWRFQPHPLPRILVTGIFEAEVKNVPTALQAVRCLRGLGMPCRVERWSTFPLNPRETELLQADAFHHLVPPRQVPELLRQFDLLLFTSRAMEGFGLPVLEALRSGVPAVISTIPSLQSFTAAGVASADPEDPAAFAAAAYRLLDEAKVWRRARRVGRAAAAPFSEAATQAALVAALKALDGPA